MLRVVTLRCLILCAALASTAPALAEKPNIESKPLTPISIGSFEAKKKRKPTQRYNLGTGDLISVDIAIIGDEGTFEQVFPPKSADVIEKKGFTVDEKGELTIPLIGRVKASGKSVRELEQTIYQKITKEDLYRKPMVHVQLLETVSQLIEVTGEVRAPSSLTLSEAPLFVMGALKLAGGVTKEGDLRHATLTRANGKKHDIDLHALLFKGDASYNLLMKAGDVLHVPANHGNKVFVMGEVLRPKMQYIRGEHLTLAEALVESRGLNPVTADEGEIYVIRPRSKVAPAHSTANLKPRIVRNDTERYQVYQLSEGENAQFAQAEAFRLLPRDMVYVAPRSITQWNRFISQILPQSLASVSSAQIVDE